MVRRLVCSLFLASLLVPYTPIHGQTNCELPDSAEAAGFQPGVKPTLEIHRAEGPIAIDGGLDDVGWRDAARATGFSENFPDEQARPPVGSEVWVTYDDEHLYLAFLADDDPAAVRSSIKDRDQMWQDDYFGILLDTYGDAAWAYFLFANPAGVQGDSRFATAGGEDDGFDIVYQTEGKITERGYQIEMAIPFRSLRFPTAHSRRGGRPSGGHTRGPAGRPTRGRRSTVTNRASCASSGP